MKNSTVMIIMFPDNSEETVRKMQVIARVINNGGAIFIEPDETENAGFIDWSDDDELPMF